MTSGADGTGGNPKHYISGHICTFHNFTQCFFDISSFPIHFQYFKARGRQCLLG